MMTSSNGNIFRVTGPLCGEFTGTGEFPAQRPVTRSFDVFFDLHLNKQLSKQPWVWWFDTPSWSLWRQCNAMNTWVMTIWIRIWICYCFVDKQMYMETIILLYSTSVGMWHWKLWVVMMPTLSSLVSQVLLMTKLASWQLSVFSGIDQSHKSHNAPVPYPTMHHFGTEMCAFLLQCGVLWDMWHVHRGIVRLRFSIG